MRSPKLALAACLPLMASLCGACGSNPTPPPRTVEEAKARLKGETPTLATA